MTPTNALGPGIFQPGGTEPTRALRPAQDGRSAAIDRTERYHAAPGGHRLRWGWSGRYEYSRCGVGSVMERAEFLGTDDQTWWLYQVQPDARIEEARRQLGYAFGWTETEWYLDPYRRQALFDFLQTNGARLLVDLDTVTYDEDRLRWISTVKDLSASLQQTADKAQPATTTKSSQAPGPARPPTPPPAGPAKKSIFKAKATSSPAASGPDPVAGETSPAAQLEETVQAVFSDLGGGGLADLAQELGVEPAELDSIVNDPDFERQVREEVARIVSA
jgi:hypothetical protein